MVMERWIEVVVMAGFVGACAPESDDSTTTTSIGNGSSSGAGTTASADDSDEMTADGGWVCPSSAYEDLEVTADQVAASIGPATPLTDDNCLEVCEDYSTATYESDPDHDWSITGCSVTGGETGDSSGSSSDSSSGEDAGPYFVTCAWFPGCL